MDTAVPLQARDHALATRPGAPGVSPPAARGVPDASRASGERLPERGLPSRRAARGHPDANAQAASFVTTRTSAEESLKDYRAIPDAAQHRERFSADVSNTTRWPSALGSCPPAACELLLSKQPCALALVRYMACSPVDREEGWTWKPCALKGAHTVLRGGECREAPTHPTWRSPFTMRAWAWCVASRSTKVAGMASTWSR